MKTCLHFACLIIVLTMATFLCASAGGVQAQLQSVVLVDDNFDETTPGWGVDHFATIQDGVDAVDPGGTVEVAEGVYAEQVVIAKDLTLQGDHKKSVINQVDDMLPCFDNFFGSTSPLICIKGSVTVTVDGFTLAWEGWDYPESSYAGIGISNIGESRENHDPFVEIANNTIILPYYFEFNNDGTVGIEANSGYGPDDLALNIHHNIIQGYDNALEFNQCDPISEECASGTFASIEVTSNNLYENRSGFTLSVGFPTSPEIHFNRIFSTISDPKYGAIIPPLAEGVVVNAEYNWWGCNAGPLVNIPGGNECVGLDVANSGIDFDPWLSLTLDPLPTMLIGQGVSVAADLLHTETGEEPSANGMIIDGIEIMFMAINGTVDPVNDETINGIVETTYTAPDIAGEETICARLDGEWACWTFKVHDPLTITDLDLLVSTDKENWKDVQGSFVEGFFQALDTSEDYYYLDVASISSNRPLKDGLHEFYIADHPDHFFDYWAGRGVVEGAEGWQGIMWEIINHEKPIFYLKVAGTNYDLIDGLQYQLYEGTLEAPLRIDGGYLPGEYTFSGRVTDQADLAGDVIVDIIFNDIPVALDQTVTIKTIETKVDILLKAVDQYPGSLIWSYKEPTHGTLTGDAPNLTYTPDVDWGDLDSFTFTVSDGELTSDDATVTIVLNDPPIAPEVGDVEWLTREEHTLTILEFTDPDGDSLVYSAELVDGSDLPDWLTFDPATRTFSGNPDNSAVGKYQINVNATDGTWTVPVTFTLTVKLNYFYCYLPLIGR